MGAMPMQGAAPAQGPMGGGLAPGSPQVAPQQPVQMGGDFQRPMMQPPGMPMQGAPGGMPQGAWQYMTGAGGEQGEGESLDPPLEYEEPAPPPVPEVGFGEGTNPNYVYPANRPGYEPSPSFEEETKDYYSSTDLDKVTQEYVDSHAFNAALQGEQPEETNPYLSWMENLVGEGGASEEEKGIRLDHFEDALENEFSEKLRQRMFELGQQGLSSSGATQAMMQQLGAEQAARTQEFMEHMEVEDMQRLERIQTTVIPQLVQAWENAAARGDAATQQAIENQLAFSYLDLAQNASGEQQSEAAYNVGAGLGGLLDSVYGENGAPAEAQKTLTTMHSKAMEMFASEEISYDQFKQLSKMLEGAIWDGVDGDPVQAFYDAWAEGTGSPWGM